MRPSLEVADIFSKAGPAYRAAHVGHLSLHQLKVMSAIERCRTAALGGDGQGSSDPLDRWKAIGGGMSRPAQNGGAASGAHYAAAKGGIVTLTKVFARELAADGVCVNAISPEPLDLDSVRALLPAEKLEAVTKSIPAGALGDPDYIAKMVTLLADPAAVSAVGATFDINGGLYLR